MTGHTDIQKAEVDEALARDLDRRPKPPPPRPAWKRALDGEHVVLRGVDAAVWAGIGLPGSPRVKHGVQ